jgi:hypothetical protein
VGAGPDEHGILTMMEPPTRKMAEATMMAFFRPILSPTGKVRSAPKKVPAWKVETMLP